MKTPISKIQYPITPKENLPKKQLLILFGVICALLLGFVLWSEFLNRPESVLPPEWHLGEQTHEQVMNFIKSDDTDTIPYGFGFNCVDAAFSVWRNACWQGIGAVQIAIQYTDSSGHMVIGFPTNDKGAIFIEPQSDSQIELRVGHEYNGQTIRGIYTVSHNYSPIYDSPPYDDNMDPE